MITALALSASLDVTYLVDELTVGAIHRPTRVLKLPGGKALNAARAIVALGRPVRAIAVLGGKTGSLMEEQLVHSGVQLRVVRASAETRSCVTVATSTELTEFYEPSAPLDPAVWISITRELSALEDSSWLALAGSVPEGTDLTALGAALAGCRDRGIRVALDTHGTALASLLGEFRPDLVKVNRFEAAALLGAVDDDELEDLARGIHDRTGELVVVTDGARGAVAVSPDAVVRAPAPASIGLYSVGSGDCFLAGLLVGLDTGSSLEDALSLATACAAANAAIPGAALFQTP